MNWIKSIYLPVVIVIILFGIILYYLFNRKPYLEGFEPQTWSTSTRDAFKKYLLSTNPSWNEDLLNSRCDMYSKDFGATDKDALYFIANKKREINGIFSFFSLYILQNGARYRIKCCRVDGNVPARRGQAKPVPNVNCSNPNGNRPTTSC